MKKIGIIVNGKEGEYLFEFIGDPANINKWREDGLEIIEFENTIPEIVVSLGLGRPWIFIQDLLNFKNPLA